MMERLSITLALLVMGVCAYRMARTYLLWRAAAQANHDPLLQSGKHGIPTVLYFTTPNCAPCQYAQRPALEALQQEFGETIQVIQVDATQDPDAATRWQVQTVPTTFILDATGKPRDVNHGVADVRKLRQQLAAV